MAKIDIISGFLGAGKTTLIKKLLSEALCLRYIYQHFRNFVEDCLRCNIDLSFSFKRVDTSLRRDKEEVVKDIIEVFNDTTLYNELLSKCAINDLL